MRLRAYIRDTSLRSRWGCPSALVLFAIEESNLDLWLSFGGARND